VLSFAEADASMAFTSPEDQPPSLGEVVICLPVAEAQAEAAATPVAGQVAHLLAHGLLHLLGYDHEADEMESQRMKAREDELLAALGYSGQYEHGH
jgi:probable rRNA maturation factor